MLPVCWHNLSAASVEMVDAKVQSAGSLAGSQSLVDVFMSPLFHKATQK